MNLDKTYRIELESKNLKRKTIDYIEADCMDDAIAIARKGFNANLYDTSRGGPSTSQKACSKSKLSGRLRFGFRSGWVTLNVEGKTIYEALKEAQEHKFVEGREITEITQALS